MDQGFEHVIQADNPMRHAGAAGLMPKTLECMFQTIQRQPTGVF
jgi:hypothetical protein